VLVAGCDSKNTPTVTADAAPASSVIPTEYPNKVAPVALAARLCEALHTLPGTRMSECCSSPPSKLLADECTRLLSASLNDKVVTVNEDKVNTCAKAMKASLVGCDWVTPSAPPLPEECKGLLEGNQDASKRCRSSLDCKPTLHCSDTGTCVAGEPVGAVCGRAVDALAVATRQTDVEAKHPTCAAHCSLIQHKCEPMPEAGASCYANTGCQTGQLCIDGKCAVAIAGAKDQPCAGTHCAEGLRCVNKVCVPKAAPGETCSNDFDCARGGCASGDGGRACGMTCTHAADLDAIRKVLNSAPSGAPAASVAPKK
jgi:hypothetical protein